MKKAADIKYPHSANLFQFCRRVLDHKFGGIRVIDRFVRWSSGVPMLGLANGELTLNGRALVRPPRNPTWGVALMAGDVFTVDGVERKVVVVQ